MKDEDYNQLNIIPHADLHHYSTKTSGWLPIHFAASLGKEMIMKLLIDNGANPCLTLKCNDKKSGIEMKWKTGFTLIKDEELRLSIKKYYKNTISEYNSTTLVNFLPPILFKIACNFLPNLTPFSNFICSTQYFSILLSPYLKIGKTIIDKRQLVLGNSHRINFFQNYDEDYVRSLGDYVLTPKERQEEIIKLSSEIDTKTIEIKTLFENLNTPNSSLG